MTHDVLPELPFSTYHGERFDYLLKEPFARELWEYLADTTHLSQMVDAVDKGKPALWPLLADIEEKFGAFITSDTFPADDVEVMVNNMIKQIMERVGFEHVACGMLPHARYIKLSGVYKKRDAE